MLFFAVKTIKVKKRNLFLASETIHLENKRIIKSETNFMFPFRIQIEVQLVLALNCSIKFHCYIIFPYVSASAHVELFLRSCQMNIFCFAL